MWCAPPLAHNPQRSPYSTTNLITSVGPSSPANSTGSTVGVIGACTSTGSPVVTPGQASIIEGWVAHYGEQLVDAGYAPITTEVRWGVDYYLAEDEHQQYLHKVPNGYCPHHSTGVECGI